MPLENGSLGLAGVSYSKLFLWSRDVDLDGIERWVQFRVIELEKLIAVKSFDEVQVVGSAEGLGIIIVATDIGAFIIELKSGQVKTVGEPDDYFATLPFMSFYTPRMCNAYLLTHREDIRDVGQC
ncbi:hypothetical protein EJB05_14254 [Eragrostis curvula]|uniref:Uncharacterized protein n=1 Tax=Eragrostis curvula TaxID=38414 RepID=A0A5J9VYS3_9POAL|nr:hypothetical protein EJB05_14254 [Eragrostis curvula]